ncbi:MAG: 3-hydroxyacyl-CoA dehydrogenase family protein [Clostridiales Family XIII bacterium]|jgi:3-hydroxybutyryl-CoA dehydrogenase|nr:3-hydroxyacyl-CoA dehydrogenase family protein [Clostridiales Family XIII bacterium]
MLLKKVGVVGAGMMGAEIALCFARAGMDTVLSDVSMDFVRKGMKRQEEILDKSVKKGRITLEDKEAALGRVTGTADMTVMSDRDLVIEAVSEVFEVKAQVFGRLDEVCGPDTIFASNTSSISITKLASSASPVRRKRFLGTHFNSPASVMKLVEVIPALLTEEEAVRDVTRALEEIGKEPVRVKDVVGFGLNRLFHVFYLEACRLVEEGVCSVEDVDKICIHGLGHPMGIFRLLDITGHDLNLKVDEIMFDAYGERYRPSPHIRKLVDSGMLGRKTGAGFYEYE